VIARAFPEILGMPVVVLQRDGGDLFQVLSRSRHFRPKSSRRRFTSAGAPRTRRNAPSPSARSSEHLAGREISPRRFCEAQGEEELGLDEIALEERGDGLAQPRDIALAARAHHDTSGVLREQRGPQFSLVSGPVDLVEHEQARHLLRADLVEHLVGHRELALEAGIARVDDVGEERRLERLVERRLERGDQAVRQVLDEARPCR
jgi:hypothetical protein